MRISSSIGKFHQYTRCAGIAPEGSGEKLEERIQIRDRYIKRARHLFQHSIVGTDRARLNGVAVVEGEGIHRDNRALVSSGAQTGKYLREILAKGCQRRSQLTFAVLRSTRTIDLHQTNVIQPNINRDEFRTWICLQEGGGVIQLIGRAMVGNEISELSLAGVGRDEYLVLGWNTIETGIVVTGRCRCFNKRACCLTRAGCIRDLETQNPRDDLRISDVFEQIRRLDQRIEAECERISERQILARLAVSNVEHVLGPNRRKGERKRAA